MGRRSLTDKERGRIHGLHEAGFSYRTIAARVRRSVSIVGRVLSTKKPSPPKPLGRPSALSERLVRRVVRRASEGGTSSTKLKAEFDLPCHARTVRLILADTDFLVFAKMEQTLDLTPDHMAKRLAWAKLQLESARDWKGVIFSDEKKFNRDGPDGFKMTWKDKRRSKKRHKKYKKRQQGGGSIMFWGGISWEGKTQLAILEGRQASEDYIYTVSEYMLPFAHLKYGTDFVYQQDNAPIHSSKMTQEFFSRMDVEVLDWPARSPDLNPIENLWATMARRVYGDGKQYDDMNELRQAVLAAWDSITLDEIRTVIDSMPRRCIQVVERKGDKTNY
jgi:transposase